MVSNKTADNSIDGTPSSKSAQLVDEHLGRLLSELFEEMDLSSDNPQEILQGLSMQGVKIWNTFIRMAPEGFKSLTKPPSRHNPLPLTGNSILMLGYLKQMICENIEAKKPDAKDGTAYTKESFDDYYADNIKIR